MATQNNFVIEYGLNIGSTEVITSAGKITAGSVSALDSDDITEGATNQYFTNAKARGAISLASGETNLSYNSSTGEFSLPQVDGGTI